MYKRRQAKAQRIKIRFEILICSPQTMSIEYPQSATSTTRPTASIAIQRTYCRVLRLSKVKYDGMWMKPTIASEPSYVAQGRKRFPRKAIRMVDATVHKPDDAARMYEIRKCGAYRLRCPMKKAVDILVSPRETT